MNLNEFIETVAKDLKTIVPKRYEYIEIKSSLIRLRWTARENLKNFFLSGRAIQKLSDLNSKTWDVYVEY